MGASAGARLLKTVSLFERDHDISKVRMHPDLLRKITEDANRKYNGSLGKVCAVYDIPIVEDDTLPFTTIEFGVRVSL